MNAQNTTCVQSTWTFVRRPAIAVITGIVFTAAVHAGPVVVPNGDFSATGNAGTVGGGVVGGAGTDVGIGTDQGPWKGTYQGVIALLAPPSLTIDSSAQTATISGLLGINVGPILDNSGYFSQVLAAPYVANKRYTFAADISTGGSLGLGALSAANVGIALRSGASVLADSGTAPAGAVTLVPIAGNDYRLTLVYDTGGTVGGNIGVQLFNIPQGLLTAALLPSVAFGNVTLNQGAITDANTQLHVSGIGSQSAEVGTPFASPLEAIVTDGGGTPLEGVIVTLSAPTSGASAALSSGSQSGYVIETVSDNDGKVTVSATANAIAGCYTVNASVPGSPSRAVFHLRNWSVAQMSGFLYAGYDPFGVLQDSIFCDGFD